VTVARRFTGRELVLATHNEGKVAEFRALLGGRDLLLESAGALGLEEPEETAHSFEANAVLKALAAARAAGRPALADDSGLAAQGLDGAPGIYSARWAGPDRDFALAMRRVHEALLERFGEWEQADRRAAFVAALCLAWPDGHVETVEGRVEGELVREPRGGRGFGYDPIFVPAGESRTFGEMEPEHKQRLSHRRRAVDALLAVCFPPDP
jgi:XTP/dITP diphosphohydrolase